MDLYLAAQAKGDPSGLPLATGVGYWENIARADIKTGFLYKPMKIDLVPWGFPCVRVEGGMYTGKGTPADSCEVGAPDTHLPTRRPRTPRVRSCPGLVTQIDWEDP